MSSLVIVESPAKARTIEKYLGKDYKVAASIGHVVDLPKKELGVDVERDFKPKYEVLPAKKKTVTQLKKAAQNAEKIFLAPDPDREGEAIAWHIARLLSGSNKPIKRMLINEITRPAVLDAIKKAGDLDKDRFEAQQARRILDRLVGYLISPMLSKKFRAGLSAGRVQSVALRVVVERERAIRAFEAKEYWSVDALLEAQAPPGFKARLVSIDGKTLDLPERFEKENNSYITIDKTKHAYIPDQDAARSIKEDVSGKRFIVEDVVKQERKRNPAPPFITSTLQQEASKKLGFSAKKTMTLAQRLYEGQDVGQGAVGLITYMRTDSPRVSKQALDMIRDYIRNFYGEDYLFPQPRQFKSKKGAQEAHEAIRPTSMDHTLEMVKPRLEKDMYRLYELIYLRFAASQMKPAVYDQTTVEIPVDKYLFRAGGRVIKFKGFLAVYEESQDEDVEKSEDMNLPPLNQGEELSVKEIIPEQHFTKPPPRFTEASLVKELEEKGIGRPSTYAQILSTIQEREYVNKEEKRFVPTPLGELINDVLIKAFPDIVDVGFTAQMEENLDKVEEGKENWVELLRRFYGPFEKSLAQADDIIKHVSEATPTDEKCPACGRELLIKWSRQGQFLGCSGYPECRFTCEFKRGEDGSIKPVCPEVLPIPCPECGKPLQIKTSDKGEFVGCTNYPECTFTSDFERGPNEEIKLVERKEEDSGIKCEKCGKPMVIKKARRTGKEFLACSGYPKCKNAKDFTRDEQGNINVVERQEEDTGIACEKCGKPMKIRRTRKGDREFLSCSGYPECKNAKDFIREEQGKIRVVLPGEEGEPCEKCGKPMVLKRGKSGTFWACTGYPECENTRPAGQVKEKPKEKAVPKKKGAKELPEEPPCEKCGKPMVERQGRYGPFIACSGYPQCKNIRKKTGTKKAGSKKSATAKSGEKKTAGAKKSRKK